MRITVIDNDAQQRSLITTTLAAAAYDWEVVDQLGSLSARMQAGQLDMLIYHWQPEIEGLRQLADWRQRAPDLPVLLLSGRSHASALAAALASGCCDYLVKPLRRSELIVRLRVLSARAHPGAEHTPTLDFGPYAFDLRGSRLKIAGQPVTLTQKEFDLALLFFRNLGRPLSRATILEAVWPHETGLSSRSMDTHVSRVRNKLGLRPDRGFKLAPVYSYGYRLEQVADDGESPLELQV